MIQRKQVALSHMGTGQTGTIIGILGGRGLTRRLEAMGIRPGKKVTKISTMMFRGPVTIKTDNTQLAIGFGMANKVIVEVNIPA